MYESIIFLYISYDLLFVFWVEGTNKNVQEYIHNRFYYKNIHLGTSVGTVGSPYNTVPYSTSSNKAP